MTAGANHLATRASDPDAGGPPSPAGQFRAFVDAFERLGYDVGPLLSAIGVRRTDLDDPDGLIPCAATTALFEQARRRRPLKKLGLRLAGETPILRLLTGARLSSTFATLKIRFESSTTPSDPTAEVRR